MLTGYRSSHFMWSAGPDIDLLTLCGLLGLFRAFRFAEGQASMERVVRAWNLKDRGLGESSGRWERSGVNRCLLRLQREGVPAAWVCSHPLKFCIISYKINIFECSIVIVHSQGKHNNGHPWKMPETYKKRICREK